MTMLSRFIVLASLALSWMTTVSLLVWAQDRKSKAPNADVKAPPDDKAGLKRLSPESAVWIDRENKRVIAEGEVCLTKGMLEMFACPKNTKEHESIVAVNGKAFEVHAALLALGAKQGQPVKFDPEYMPAKGARVDVYCFWTDQNGKKQKAAAQQWVRNVKTKKALEYYWVFAGSDFWLDESTGKRHYLGDAGDFICVSNFPSATLDLPVKSPQDNENLIFEAFTENIPPRGTKVTLVLAPQLDMGDAKKRGEEVKKDEK